MIRMKNESKNDFVTIIKAQMEQLATDIASLKEKVKPIAPDNAIGRLSRMEAINEKSMSEANLLKAETRVRKLEQALLRLEKDDFGECVECGSDIPLKRLKILPETTVCIECMKDS